MQMETATSLSILERYRAKTPKSAALYERAKAAFPSGLTHDSRVLDPYPLFVERAAGPRKWCVDGHEYVDYFGGHGALLLGHCAPEVVAAVQRQVTLGTHFGSAHELELRWAELIKTLVPGAERVRFTSSGTEATHLALRLARAFTGQGQGRALSRPLPRLARPRCRRQQLALRRDAADRRAARHRRGDHSDAHRRRAAHRVAAGLPGRYRGGDRRALGRVMGPGAAAAGFSAGAARGHRAPSRRF